MIEPLVTIPPVREPVTLDEVMMSLRIAPPSAEDIMLETFIAAARRYFEWRTGRTVHQTGYDYILDYFPSGPIDLPRATPLISISSVVYKDSAGVPHTVDAGDYIADRDSTPGRLVLGYGKEWPSFTPYPVSPVRISYLAGIAITSPLVLTDADGDIKYVISLLVGGMYENRESIVLEQGSISQIAVQYGVEHYLAKLQVGYAF